MEGEPYTFCEPFAGSAAMTYELVGGKRPPISYMGSKTGYAKAIAAILGLTTRPAGVVLGEVGPFAAVHACLGGATGMSAEDVAAFCLTGEISFRVGDADSGFNAGKAYARPKTATEHGCVTPCGPLTVGPRCGAIGTAQSAAVADIIRSWKNEEPRALWTRLKAKGWPSLMPVEGGRWLGPQSVEEVAGFAFCCAGAYRAGHPESGYNKDHCEARSAAHKHGSNRALVDYLPENFTGSAFPPLAVWQGTAETLVLPNDLSSWVIFADPPYQGTTGYPHGDCPRETVLRLARGWSERGATVAISEAVGLAAELGAGWWEVDITWERRGQKRTFSKQQHEWLTLNQPPVPPAQLSLFGGR